MTDPSTTTDVSPELRVPAALDAAFGLAGLAFHVVVRAGRTAQSAAGPLVKVARWGTAAVPGSWPADWLESLVRRGAVRREVAEHEIAEALDRLVPLVAVALLRRLDLTKLVEDHVDIERIVEQVDLDAIAQRLDVDAVAARLDLDTVVARVDLDAIARRLDLDGLIATVDLDAVAARLDVDAVIDRVDLLELARTVIVGVDLPEIIRDSTGAVASDTMREVRMQSISGDDAVARVVDRLLLRHHRRDGDRTTRHALPLADETIGTPAAGNGARPR